MTLRGAARPDDIRRQNRRLMLASLRREGELSRTELTRRTQLSPSTVSLISGALIEEGFLEERPGPPVVGRGRPQVAIRLDPRAAMAAAVSLTLDRILVRLVDYAGREIAAAADGFDMLAAPAGALLERTAATLRAALAQAGGERRLRHVSLGVQGVADAEGRRMIWSPITPERDLPLAERLEAEFDAPVLVSNDCAVIAQGLRFDEPAHYGEDFAVIQLSHGVGMGLNLRGAPFLGRRSSAMEFGHMVHVPGGARCRCGGSGCIEAYAGSYAILRRALGRPEHEPPRSGVDQAMIAPLLARARRGPGPERDAFLAAGKAIGYGLRNLFTLLDPLPTALVGPGAMAFDLMEPEIRAALAEARGEDAAAPLEFRLYADEIDLLLKGAALTSLLHLDEAAAMAEAAEGGLRPAARQA